jgi:hypothetical protein
VSGGNWSVVDDVSVGVSRWTAVGLPSVRSLFRCDHRAARIRNNLHPCPLILQVMNGTGRNSPAVRPKGRPAKLPGGLIAFQPAKRGGCLWPLARPGLSCPASRSRPRSGLSTPGSRSRSLHSRSHHSQRIAPRSLGSLGSRRSRRSLERALRSPCSRSLHSLGEQVGQVRRTRRFPCRRHRTSPG